MYLWIFSLQVRFLPTKEKNVLGDGLNKIEFAIKESWVASLSGMK
jgi:hypothetical protein